MSKAKTRFGLGIITLWVGLTAYAFWWFEFKNLRPFDTRSSGAVVRPELNELDTRLRQVLPQSDHIAVVHFWNPNCYCNRFNQEHLRAIMQQYRDRGVDFYVAVAEPLTRIGQQRQLERDFGDVPVLTLSDPAWQGLIPSSPAAAVVGSAQALTYFGPYSEGAMCSRQGGSFVETVLDTTLAGNISAQLNLLSFGCYCDWTSL